MGKRWVQYCSWDLQPYNEEVAPVISHIYPTVFLVKMCGGNPDRISQVVFEENDNGAYTGWLAEGETELSFIRPNVAFGVQFPEHISVYEKRGDGKRVFLNVVELHNPIPETKPDEKDEK